MSGAGREMHDCDHAAGYCRVEDTGMAECNERTTKPARTAGHATLYAAEIGVATPGGAPRIATCDGEQPREIQRENAAHLAACWNLVEDYGGDPEALRRAVTALETLLKAVNVREPDPLTMFASIERARAALDALGRRP